MARHRITDLERKASKVRRERSPAVAVTIKETPPNRQTPVRFTLDGGDGTVLRGAFDTAHFPRAGMAGAAIRTQGPDDETYWVIAVFPDTPDPVTHVIPSGGPHSDGALRTAVAALVADLQNRGVI